MEVLNAYGEAGDDDEAVAEKVHRNAEDVDHAYCHRNPDNHHHPHIDHLEEEIHRSRNDPLLFHRLASVPECVAGDRAEAHGVWEVAGKTVPGYQLEIEEVR